MREGGVRAPPRGEPPQGDDDTAMRTDTRARGLVGALLAVLLVVALVAPALFVLVEANHDCSGDDCAVCQIIEGAFALVNQGADVPHSLALEGAAGFLVLLCLQLVGRRAPGDTPISLKVRLNV